MSPGDVSESFGEGSSNCSGEGKDRSEGDGGAGHDCGPGGAIEVGECGCAGCCEQGDDDDDCGGEEDNGGDDRHGNSYWKSGALTCFKVVRLMCAEVRPNTGAHRRTQRWGACRASK